MRKIFLLTLVGLCLLFAKENTAKENNDYNWAYKDWSVNRYNNGTLKAITHGKIIWGHEFGIVKIPDECEQNLLWLTISTYEKDLKSLKGKKVEFEIKVDEKKYNLDLKIVYLSKFTTIMHIVLFEQVNLNSDFINILKKGKKLFLTIKESNEIAGKFDIKNEEFSLSGFVANYTKLEASCKNPDELLIPPSKKEELIVKTPKKYDVKNLISDNTKCDSLDKINKYLNNYYRMDEITLDRNYLYFGYGNDGQDEFEDINVINICNVNEPKEVTKISSSGAQTFGLYSDNGYIYIDSSTYDEDRFQIIDSKKFKVLSTITYESAINPFTVDNNHLYIITNDNKIMNVFDLTIKSKPIKIKKIEIPFQKYSANSIDVDESYIYITGNSNLKIYDKKTYSMVSNKTFPYRTSSILVKNNKALMGLWGNGGHNQYIAVIDLSEKNKPTLLKIQKVDEDNFKKINNTIVAYDKYNAHLFHFDSIEQLYNEIIDYNNTKEE